MSSCPYGGDGASARVVREEGVKTEYTDEMVYGDYLGLDAILNAQHPKSPDRNEMLFIIQHQTSELWMKLALHELSDAIEAVRADRLGEAFKMLARVSRIFEQLVSAWSVLATLTPSEYNNIRPHLGESSGFQSWQYRQIEFLLGNKNEVMLKVHEGTADRLDPVREAFAAKSLYDESIALLARRGFDIPQDVLNRDVRQHYVSNDGVRAAWKGVYQDTTEHWDAYQLAEELIDLEDVFRQWRFRHLTTVERVIGFKSGTGGSSGVKYLRRMLDVVLFPELWEVRIEL